MSTTEIIHHGEILKFYWRQTNFRETETCLFVDEPLFVHSMLFVCVLRTEIIDGCRWAHTESFVHKQNSRSIPSSRCERPFLCWMVGYFLWKTREPCLRAGDGHSLNSPLDKSLWMTFMYGRRPKVSLTHITQKHTSYFRWKIFNRFTANRKTAMVEMDIISILWSVFPRNCCFLYALG